MYPLYNKLSEDIRFLEGLKACINCGTCTAICPAAEFYNYDPRIIADEVQKKDDTIIEELLKSDVIWYCGECMSCKTRCPRGNAPGLIIIALRNLSQELGYFVESEKGKQQLAVKRTVGQWIIEQGYCLYLEGQGIDVHPEQGPIWDWEQKNWKDVFERMGANYQGEGPGILRKIPKETLDEVRKIFEITGGLDRFSKIEEFSRKKAEESHKNYNETSTSEYLEHIINYNSEKHTRQ